MWFGGSEDLLCSRARTPPPAREDTNPLSTAGSVRWPVVQRFLAIPRVVGRTRAKESIVVEHGDRTVRSNES